MTTDLLVKAQLGNHYRTFTLPASSDSASPWGYQALVATLRRVYAVKDGLGMRVMYVDEEGDWITISSQEEFQEATRQCLTELSGSVVRVRIEVVDIPASFSLTEPMDPMMSSLYASLDISNSATTPIATKPLAAKPAEKNENRSQAVERDDPPPELVREYVSAIMDGSQPEFVPPNGDSGAGEDSEPVDEQKPKSDVSVYVNEFHYYRLIIQTAINDSLRSMFDSPDTNGPDGWDNALNELQFRRVIVQSAVESAFHTLFTAPPPIPQATNQSTDRPPIHRQRSLESIRQSLEPIVASTASTTETIIQAIHARSKVVASQIVQAVQGVGQRHVEEMGLDERFRIAGQQTREIVGTVERVARSWMGSVGAFLEDVGERVLREDPFGGVDIGREEVREQEVEEPLVRRSPVTVPGEVSSAERQREDTNVRELSPVTLEPLPSTPREETVPVPAPTPKPIPKSALKADEAENLLQMDDIDEASTSPTFVPDVDSQPDQIYPTINDIYSSNHMYHSATSDFPTRQLSTFDSFHAEDLMPDGPIRLEIVDDAQSESDMSRVADVDDGEGSEGEDEFVLVEEEGEDDGLGVRSSSLIFPVL
ncbi:hypothetical protein HK097_006073 [Rhizophlyctis rosea]|uniref:PB1 domain-containing protein n=1 Tax=Rhizophlyctis rosea TaxID=64517 RepID=A0AAD5SG62_9FUNG|nr:hypothetical protein HK097_006073 [Rhizophlyctis rosea]